MNLKCIYCGEELENVKYYLQYCCKNHNIDVSYYMREDGNGFYSVELENLKYSVVYWCDKDMMAIIIYCNDNIDGEDYNYFKYKKELAYISRDPNLTPENFENKVKLYLAFQ
jgi:hypothetical protein